MSIWVLLLRARVCWNVARWQYIQFSGVRERQKNTYLLQSRSYRAVVYHLCHSSVDQTLKSKAPFLHTLFPGGYSILGGYSTGPLMYPGGWVAA